MQTEISESRDVTGHMTIRFAIRHFLLVAFCNWASICSKGLHGCGGHGDSAGNPWGRLRSVRGIRGIGLLTAQGHRGAGARRKVALHAAHAQHQHHSSDQVAALCTAVHCNAVYLVPTPPSVKCELSTDHATAAKVHSPHHWALY